MPKAVQPRVCGEHISEWLAYDKEDGSAPRVRGTRLHFLASFKILTVQPRVCGEH